MTETNWDLVQFKYEVLGSSLEELAAEYSLSLPVLKFNASNWKQIPLAQHKKIDIRDAETFEDLIDNVAKQISDETKAFTIIKQKFLGPKYIELETILLHKTIEMANNLNTTDPLSASTIRKLTTVLSDLLAQNPLLGPSETGHDGVIDREWKISFVESKNEDREE